MSASEPRETYCPDRDESVYCVPTRRRRWTIICIYYYYHYNNIIVIYCNIQFDEISIVFRKNSGAAKSCEQIRFSHVHNTMMRVFTADHFSFHFSDGAKNKKKEIIILILGTTILLIWHSKYCNTYLYTLIPRISIKPWTLDAVSRNYKKKHPYTCVNIPTE